MPKKKARGVPAINAGSMADIAFLLLIFFIVATTMDVDRGIATKLPPLPEDEQEDDDQIHDRNVFVVLVNAGDQLLVENEYTSIENLRDMTIAFVTNNGVNPNLSDNPDKAIVSLQNDRGTSYDMYIQVQNELKAAYNRIRDEAALQKFGKKYNDLTDEDQIDEIQDMYPIKISEAEPVDIGG
ncbi:MAG: biopolymer transporter ExbD [Bacteroidia bacterium]|nr:biopolymer transporter ExbD [Bacteroidia bacterium]